MKQKALLGFELVLAKKETDFLSVAFTTRPQCLIYYVGELIENQKRGYPTQIPYPTPGTPKTPGKQPE